MAAVDCKSILKVLEEESCWMTFDELYKKIQADCDWTTFALQLEQLVEQGDVQYILPCGADVGYYGMNELSAHPADTESHPISMIYSIGRIK